MEFPADLRYHPEHMWVRAEGSQATVGITEFAQDQLGEVVFVELPEVGAKVQAGKEMGAVESAKSVSELVAPVSGEVIEVNSALEDQPSLINHKPNTDGWIARIRLAEPGELQELMDAQAYAASVGVS